MMYPKLLETIDALDVTLVPEARQLILQALIDLLYENRNTEVNLNFVCTHNSRRSHLAQIWCKAMADYFGWEGKVNTFSSGTESTAMFPMIVKTLISQGFDIEKQSEQENPVYEVLHAENTSAQICFSKSYDHDSISAENLSAIMVCSDADQNCPIIPNVKNRIPITYEDPKKSDGTDHQVETYTERSLQIATEMKYIYKNLKELT